MRLAALTNATLMADRQVAIRRLLAHICLTGVLAAISFGGWPVVLPIDWRVAIGLAAILMFYVSFDYWADDYHIIAVEALRPLAGAGCLRLREIEVQEAEVAAMLAGVRAQNRPIAWADLWHVESWLRARDGERRRAEEREACWALNRLPHENTVPGVGGA